MGWSEGVLMLLEAGARQLPDERKQMTPLMLAAARDHDHIIRILLSPRFLSSMLPRENDELLKHGDAAAGFARLRAPKLTSASRLEGTSPRGSLALRYCPALLNILEAKSANDRRAVDWAGLHDKQSPCALYLRKIHREAASIMHSADAQQPAPRCTVASEPVILQRSFLSWAYMQFFAAKHFEAMTTRPASAQLACLSEGCSCSAMFCVPGLCFCLKGDLNSRNAADLGCLRDDGMNLDLNFSDPFVGDQCETVIRSVLENGLSPNLFEEFDTQMYNIPPNHDIDCNWFSIGTKLATPDSALAFRAASNDVPGLSPINMVGTALVLQLLPRLLSLKDDPAMCWRWSDLTYAKFRQDVLGILSESFRDSRQSAACFAQFKRMVLDLCCEFSRVCEGSSSWGRAMLLDWQDFGSHLWRAELFCCNSPLSL
jgi:hypothetical protein